MHFLRVWLKICDFEYGNHLCIWLKVKGTNFQHVDRMIVDGNRHDRVNGVLFLLISQNYRIVVKYLLGKP